MGFAESQRSRAEKMSSNVYIPLVLTVYIFTFLTGLPSNLLAFYTFLVKVRQKPTPVDILLLNLTVSDIFLLIFLPFKMAEAASGMVWPLPAFLCPLTNYFYYNSIYISSFFLMAVSVDRYLGVAFPIKYKLRRRPAYAIATSVVFWLIICAHCSIVYIVQYEVLSPNGTATSNNVSNCYEHFSPTQRQILLPVRLEFFVVLFCLPFTVTIFCYVNLVRILVALPNISAWRKQRAVGLALVTLFNFIVCFAPYNLSHVVGFVQNKSPSWRVYALLLSTLNAALDPAIFYFSSTAVQRAFANCLATLWHKLNTILSRCHLPCLTRCGEGGSELKADSENVIEESTT
ncbi:free fatty acid receptor 2-like isoform X1 [Malaclemys terrapin pileata]|uniref:free fatty acid receptor 2-like isoform X1 n=2 Tax=Malaclemys terrapin pileata TaxID=2991368 RepID=UPI0023A8D93F|nr:free fatty acid receptor 2-like isoform X1 [Malaclemys terrapin pileata]